MGLDPSQPSVRLWDAVRMHHLRGMERERRTALTLFNAQALSMNPKEWDYWTSVSHLYPARVVEEGRARAEHARETAKQMQALEEMRAVALSQQMEREAREERRREREAQRRSQGGTEDA